MNETKEHILKITFSLFLQKNFKEVTMSEIVKKTGLSKGGFYHHFESKEDLFKEVITHYFERMVFGSNDIGNPKSLKAYYMARISQFDRVNEDLIPDDNDNTELFNLNFFSLMFDALKILPEFQERMKAYHKKEKEDWKKIISKAKKNKEISTTLSDDQIADLFTFSADGLALNNTLYNSVHSMKADISSLWNGIYDAIKV